MSGRPDFVAQAIAPLRKLVPYDPGHDLPAIRRQFAGRTLAELGSNENPWGPSPRVLERCAQLDASTLLRYPDPLGFDLRRALAARLGVDNFAWPLFGRHEWPVFSVHRRHTAASRNPTVWPAALFWPSPAD